MEPFAGKTPVSDLATFFNRETHNSLVDALSPPHPRGTPGAGKGLTHSVYDASKARKVLGINFKGLEETVRDTEEELRKRGWGVAA